MSRLLFSPDPRLLTRTERFAAWLWSKHWAHALFGWVLLFFPEKHEPDDLGDTLKTLGFVTLCLIVLALAFLIGGIR